ncbi:MAG TPA: hypothetical protein VNN74_02985 [Candidatus Micrarchaeia archaeon]|nr:hypothetical protein [Candidatus Micrarchaeia archaeon]
MAKRPKKKSSAAPRRPGPAARPAREPDLAPRAPVGAEEVAVVAGAVATAPPVGGAPAASGTAAAAMPSLPAAESPVNGSPAPGPRPLPSGGSFLPTRSERVTSRAERRRQAEAALVPMDETPAIPADRVPFIASDLRRIGAVALVMIACIIIGTVIFR